MVSFADRGHFFLEIDVLPLKQWPRVRSCSCEAGEGPFLCETDHRDSLSD